MKTQELFDLRYTKAAPLFAKCVYPWEVLPHIEEFIILLGQDLPEKYDCIKENVWVENTVKVHPSADISGPCIIGAGTEVRPGAFIRGNVLIGENCVIGHSAELINCILFDSVHMLRYNYVGDSVLGYKSRLGAGCITANVKCGQTDITVNTHGEKTQTGLRKLGAMVGDYTEIGCNSVLNPGTVIGKHVSIYPLSSVRGCIRENAIYKSADHIVIKK